MNKNTIKNVLLGGFLGGLVGFFLPYPAYLFCALLLGFLVGIIRPFGK